MSTLSISELNSKTLNKLFTYHDIVCSMTLEDEVSLLDPFTHTQQEWRKIFTFDFIGGKSTTEREKVMIDQTFCTLVVVSGKFLEKGNFQKVLKKIDKIRKIIKDRLENLSIYLNEQSKNCQMINKSDFFF